jgi:hypothetical protein
MFHLKHFDTIDIWANIHFPRVDRYDAGVLAKIVIGINFTFRDF